LAKLWYTAKVCLWQAGRELGDSVQFIHQRIIVNFDDFTFDPRVNAGIKQLGYTVPTPIQAQAIQPCWPAAM
jgi:hypothetical protein